MTHNNTVTPLFTDHQGAEAAARKLAHIKHLSVVGTSYYTDEKIVGFYSTGERLKSCGNPCAFWGGHWGGLFGGAFMLVPVIGHAVVLGYLASMVITAVEGAAVVGGLSALGAVLYGSGIPKDNVIACETAIKADAFLVAAHGPAEEMARAKAILGTLGASRVDLHDSAASPESPSRLA